MERLPPPPHTSYEQHMMRGWERSKGARLEYEYAGAMGMVIRKQD